MNKKIIHFLLRKWSFLVNDAAVQFVNQKQLKIAEERKIQVPQLQNKPDFNSVEAIDIIKEKIQELCPSFKDKLDSYDDYFDLDFNSLYEIYCQHNLLQISKIKKCINLCDKTTL